MSADIVSSRRQACRCCNNDNNSGTRPGSKDVSASRVHTRSAKLDERQQTSRKPSDKAAYRTPSGPRKDVEGQFVSGRYGRRRSDSAPDAILDRLHCGKDMPSSPRLHAASSPERRAGHTGGSSGERVCTPPPVSTRHTASLPMRSSSVRRKKRTRRHLSGGTYTCRLCGEVKQGGGRYVALTKSFLKLHNREGDGSQIDNVCSCCSSHHCRAGHRDEKDVCWHSSVWEAENKNQCRCSATNHRCCNSAQNAEETDYSPALRSRILNDVLPYRHRSVDFDPHVERRHVRCFREALDMNENKRQNSRTSFTVSNDSKEEATFLPGRRKRRSYPGLTTSSRRQSPNEGLAKAMKNRLHATSSSSGPSRGQECNHTSTSTLGSREGAKQNDLSTTTDDDGDTNENERDCSSTADDDVASRQPLGGRDNLLMYNLSNMWRRHRLCDVILRSNGQEIAAHKLALAAFSDNFARRYCEGAKRNAQVILEVPDTSVGGIEEVLRFVYTGNIRITSENVGHVLAAATFLHIGHVVNKCKEMLLNPDVDTVIQFSALVEKYRITDNMTFFYDFMCKNFLRVSRTRGWKTLTFGHVFDLLSEDNLNLERELDVFHAAVSWIDGDRVNRLTFAADLIGCVRFVYITPEEIAKHVETKHFLFQGDQGKELLLCIYRHHALQTCGCQHGHRGGQRLPRRRYVALDQCNSANVPSRSVSSATTTTCQHHKDRDRNACAAQPHDTLPDRPPPTPTPPPATFSPARPTTPLPPFSCDSILSVGGVDPFHPEEETQSQLVEQFHPINNCWSTLTRLPAGRHHHGVAVLGGAVYVIGGSVRDDLNPEQLCNPTASCYRYDLASGQWSAIAPLNTARMYHAVAILDGVLYVLAGQTQHSRLLSSVEYYLPDTDEWESGVDLSEGRIGVAVAPFREQLYAVGGFLETQKEHVVRGTVEVYNPRTSSWRSLKNLPTPRCHAGLVSCKDKLFLVGGSTFTAHSPNISSLPSILKYDDIHDRWDRIQTLNLARHDMGIAVLGCRIFIVGGVSSTENRVLNDIECYDVEGDYWLDDVEPIRSPALGLVCVTVRADEC